ncbi:uncharacterized protein LOC118736017 [Rhagoletis pomonella]|uniref:uncharacterized protein LOC118736017 n=1 Tax=Rhagoletis pomonella TaxID=28610 RepID=UPI0017812420|nr:uncharacterized protein LOC118736017 [Rhagoletis pomonella]
MKLASSFSSITEWLLCAKCIVTALLLDEEGETLEQARVCDVLPAAAAAEYDIEDEITAVDLEVFRRSERLENLPRKITISVASDPNTAEEAMLRIIVILISIFLIH